MRIERLVAPVGEGDVDGLVALLVDAVDSGAAVSFLAPVDPGDARAWWSRTVASTLPRSVVLVARDASGIAGSVQLHPAWAPNQPHRAELAKLMVHRRARGAGVGERLLRAAEDAALAAGWTLLTLDAKRGAPAERLYRRLGWTHVGIVPGFALDPDGVTLHDTAIYYKQLDRR